MNEAFQHLELSEETKNLDRAYSRKRQHAPANMEYTIRARAASASVHGGYIRRREWRTHWSPQAEKVHVLLYDTGSVSWPEAQAIYKINRKSFQRCIWEIERVYGVRMLRKGSVVPYTTKKFTRYVMPECLR